jgi:heat shock protein HtpX
MFALIRANRWKSVGLIAAMALLFVLFGFALAASLDPAAGPAGVVVALIVWAVMVLVATTAGEAILLAQAGAREVDRLSAPQLHNVVEEMCIASGLKTAPKVYLIDTPVPNAFAVGLTPKRAAVAVTTGLLARLDRDELQGVVAHEIAHIANRDTLFMTLAGVTLGAIVMLADVRVRGWRVSSRGSRDSGKGAAVAAIVAILIVVLAPLLARLLYFACSRRREYLADACAAQFTRYPEGLASALEKISGAQSASAEASRVLAPMYIVSPLAARSERTSLFGTHPPAADRIRILRGIGKTASLAAYEEAYRALNGDRRVIGARNLRASVDGPVRTPSPHEGAAVNVQEQWRNVNEILHKAEGMLALACACGLRTRLPPDWDHPTVKCPKCGTIHALPTAPWRA